MNPAEEFSNLQNPSAMFSNVQQHSEDFSSFHSASKRTGGIGRGKKYPGADVPNDAFVGDDYIVMEDAYGMFDSEGERRSVRMIAEYCKTGELVCSYDSDDKRWHITQESVENKIKKIKALNARKVQSNPQQGDQHTSEAFTAAPRRAETTHQHDEQNTEVEQTIKKLKQEIFDLSITNRGKDYFIEQLQKERDAFLSKIESSSVLIGELKTQLLQLEAPKQERAQHTATRAAWHDATYNPAREGDDTLPSEAHLHVSLPDEHHDDTTYE